MSTGPAVWGFFLPPSWQLSPTPWTECCLAEMHWVSSWHTSSGLVSPGGWTAVAGTAPCRKAKPKRGLWGAPSRTDLWHPGHGSGRSGAPHYPRAAHPNMGKAGRLPGHSSEHGLCAVGESRQLCPQLCPSTGAKAAGSCPPPRFHMKTQSRRHGCHCYPKCGHK